MDILVNKTSRAISVDSLLLVPGKPCRVESVKSLSDQYPRLAQMLSSGDVVLQKSTQKTEAVEPVEENVTVTLRADTPAENTEEPIAERRQGLRRKKG